MHQPRVTALSGTENKRIGWSLYGVAPGTSRARVIEHGRFKRPRGTVFLGCWVMSDHADAKEIYAGIALSNVSLRAQT